MLNAVPPRHSKRHADAGMASVEIVPIILLFAMLFNFTLGFFGVIHSGILNSIAARNYAFETFRNRTSLVYLRDDGLTSASNEVDARYTKTGFRFHGIISETNNGAQAWIATQRPIKFTDAGGLDEPLGDKGDHTALVRTVQSVGKVSDTFTGKTAEEGKAGVNPVWIQTLYGICLNSTCSRMN
jgi:hypothetical protein